PLDPVLRTQRGVDVHQGAPLSGTRAIVTGAAGQDGSYLSDLLLDRGYDIVKVDRGDVDLLDQKAVRALLHEAAPQEIYNLASPRRPATFLPSKVAHGVAAIAAGRERELMLGDLDARRDWGYAPDYVHAMWLMLQQAEPGDYVLATGELHSVRELVELAF